MATARRSRGTRRGITILEVLISIGILAIGLTSVLAMVPAARSQSARAVILDRAAALASNVLADAVTFGLLLADGSTLTSGTVTPVVIDAAGAVLASATNGSLKNTGIFGFGVASSPAAFHQSVLQSRDDIVLVSGTTSPDDPPLNSVIDGTRGYEGRMTGLLCLSGIGGGLQRASVVVFHSRDVNLIGLGAGGNPLITGTMVSGTLALLTADLRGRQLDEFIRPGTVAYASGTFHQLTAATVANEVSSGGTTIANVFLTSVKDAAIGSGSTAIAIQFLPDSVGLAERTYTPEAVGPFTQ
jgi:type II secretory pathway pseudopilin PulG